MAIDTSLFAADLPAGSYTAGQVVQLNCVAGPAVVRSGRGSALLKRITSMTINSYSGSTSKWKVFVTNSDWIDPAISFTVPMRTPSAMDRRTGCVQSGNNCPLTPNSSWNVYAVCIGSVTTTKANTIACMLDIDYPSVSSVIDPDALVGIPTSLEVVKGTNVINAAGTATSAAWISDNVDIFKAGYQYALCKTELAAGVATAGFIAFASAAGMGGLSRIIPITNDMEDIRIPIEYSSVLVKGPMDVRYMLFNDNDGTATTSGTTLILDYVKRKV